MKSFISSKRFRWILVAAWMLVIFFFSAQNAEKSSGNNRFVLEILKSLGIDLDALVGGDINFIIRKLAHMTEYFILMLLVYKGVVKEKGKIIWMELIVAFAVTVVYAASDEVHQYFVPGRACMVRDVAIDAAGAVAAMMVILVQAGRYRTK